MRAHAPARDKQRSRVEGAMRRVLLGLLLLVGASAIGCYERTVAYRGPYGHTVACRQIWTPATPFRNGYWRCV